MGKTFVHRVLTGERGTPKKVIVFSRDEAKQHSMRMSYLHKHATTDEVIYRNFMNVLEFRIGDVRDFLRCLLAIRDADIVVNAAALKQVPVCEYFPTQAVMTNCIGAYNIVRAIEENGYPVQTVVAISTDKACKPVNVMGMTKAVQERIFLAANILNPSTRFVCVRYGNVLASRGSVIPLFHDQIRHGGPVTVTVPDMTRFLLTLNEAVDTVFAAIENAKRGENLRTTRSLCHCHEHSPSPYRRQTGQNRRGGNPPWGKDARDPGIGRRGPSLCGERQVLCDPPDAAGARGRFPSRAQRPERRVQLGGRRSRPGGTVDLLKRHGLLDVPKDFESAEEMLR